MFLEVYPDIIFILNLFLDFILLSILKKVNRKDCSIGRRIIAAAFGAFVAAAAGIFPGMNVILRFMLMNVITAIIMLAIAFGRLAKRDLMKQVITLYLITYFTGGLINSIYYYTNMRLSLIALGNSIIYSNIPIKYIIIVVLLLLPISLLILWALRFYRSNNRETFEVELFLEGRSIRTKGLYDTGNCLYEPIFRKPVIIMEERLLAELLTPQENRELENAKFYMEGKTSENNLMDITDKASLQIRIIPYQSVGKPHGLMLGLVLDKVLIDKGKEKLCNEKVTAAICDNCLSTKDEYHVILHKELLT